MAESGMVYFYLECRTGACGMVKNANRIHMAVHNHSISIPYPPKT